MLLAVFLVSGVYGTVVIYGLCGSAIRDDGFSVQDDCYGYLGIVYSTKVPEKNMDPQRWLNFGTVLILIAMIVLLKAHLKQVCEETSESMIKPSDFTLLMKNIPTETSHDELKKFITVKGYPNCDLDVSAIANVNFAYNIGGYVKLLRAKNKLLIAKEVLLKKLQKYDRTFRQRTSRYSRATSKISEINTKIHSIDGDLKNFLIECEHGFNNTVSSRAFITFNSQRVCKKVRKFWLISPLKRLWIDLSSVFKCWKRDNDHFKILKGNYIMIEKAPEPLDIIWENLGVPLSTKIWRRLLTYSMSFILTLIGFFIILLISKTQEEIKQANHDYALEISLSILCSLTISVLNGLLKFIIEFFSQFERYTSYTKFETSRAFKLAIMQFINMSLVPFFLFLLFKNIFKQKTLLQNIFFVFLGNIIFEPVAIFLDPWYLFRIHRQKQIRENIAHCTLTQIEANKHFEGPVPEMSHKFANMTKNILSAAFLAPIFPFGLILCVLALVVTYWLDK
jgi:hypothetical protein